MLKLRRSAGALVVALVAAVAVAACGSSSNTSSTSSTASTSSTSSTSGGTRGTINFVMGVAPQSLDPGLDYTTQGSEFNWLTYTGLTTYGHGGLKQSTTLIPGLATALPTISDGGKTYTMTLRPNLKFSNGQAVKASDFTHTVERAIKIPWGGAGAFITPYIVGADAYSKGKASTISGIQTNDSTGKIVIHLTQAYGPFANVLAFPALGIVPSSTPMKVEATNPPPGVGPYMSKNIVPNKSFEFVANPEWASEQIPGIPAGHDNYSVTINSNVSSNALAVLNNSQDVFDWADTVPGSLVSQIQSQAASRYHMINLGGSTYYIFMNVTKPPFNNQLVREAVVTGLNENAMNRLGSGTLAPGCFFLSPAIPGHPPAGTPCPYGTPGNGNLTKAKALIKQSGMAGTPVTVYSETRAPRQQWMTYYTQFLNQIGLHATQKVVADATYWQTVGASKSVDPQTGFADWNQDFPNPVDFYGVLLDGHAIQAQNNENFGQTNDPYVNKEVAKLGATPTTEISKVVPQWQKLEEYVAKKAYVAVFGYEKFPFFTSQNIVQSPANQTAIYGWDLSELDKK